MSHTKIAKLVAEVSRELRIDIPDIDKMSIMQEVRNLVKTNHPVPELMNSDSEPEKDNSSDVEIVDVTGGKDGDDNAIEIPSDRSDESCDSSASAPKSSLAVENFDRTKDSSISEISNRLDYSQSVNNSQSALASDVKITANKSFLERLRQAAKNRADKRSPWIIRRRKKSRSLAKNKLLYSKKEKLAHGEIGLTSSDGTKKRKQAAASFEPIIFKKTGMKKAPWRLKNILPVPKSVSNGDKVSRLEELENLDCTNSTSGLGSITHCGRKPLIVSHSVLRPFKTNTSDIIKNSMKKYPGIVLKDLQVKLKNCIRNNYREEHLLRYGILDVSEECRRKLLHKCGVAKDERFELRWEKTQVTPKPIQVCPNVYDSTLNINRFVNLWNEGVTSEHVKQEMEMIGTNKLLIGASDYNLQKSQNDLNDALFGLKQEKSDQISDSCLSGEQLSQKDPEIKETQIIPQPLDSEKEKVLDNTLILDPATGHFIVEALSQQVKQEPEKDFYVNERSQNKAADEASSSSYKIRSQPFQTETEENLAETWLDPTTGHFIFKDLSPQVKQEPKDDLDEIERSQNKAAVFKPDSLSEKVSKDLSVCNRPASSSTEDFRSGSTTPSTELYSEATDEDVLPIEQIENAVKNDVIPGKRPIPVSSDWKYYKSTLADRVARIEKLMGTISAENKDGIIDHFKHFALQKAKAELDSVKEQTGLVERAGNDMECNVTPQSLTDFSNEDPLLDSNHAATSSKASETAEMGAGKSTSWKRERKISSRPSYREVSSDSEESGSESDSADQTTGESESETESLNVSDICMVQKQDYICQDKQFLSKFDMLIRRELYKILLAPETMTDDFEKALPYIMDIKMDMNTRPAVKVKFQKLKVKLRKKWLNLIAMDSPRTKDLDQMKKARLQAKSLEYLRVEILEDLKLCVSKTMTYQTLCKTILVSLEEILETHKFRLVELNQKEINLLLEEEQARKKRDLQTQEYMKLQMREAVRLRNINLQETQIAKQKKEALSSVEINQTVDCQPTECPSLNMDSDSNLPAKTCQLLNELITTELDSGKDHKGRYVHNKEDKGRNRRTDKRRYENSLGKDMSKVRTKADPQNLIYPPQTELQKRCPFLFFKLQQHVQNSLVKSTGNLLSDTVRENLAYKIATNYARSYAQEHAEDLKSLENKIERKCQESTWSVKEEPVEDFIVVQNIDDDDDDDDDDGDVNSLSNKAYPSPTKDIEKTQNWTHDVTGVSFIPDVKIKQEPMELEEAADEVKSLTKLYSTFSTPVDQSQADVPSIPVITDFVPPSSSAVQYLPKSSLELTSHSTALKSALANKLQAHSGQAVQSTQMSMPDPSRISQQSSQTPEVTFCIPPVGLTQPGAVSAVLPQTGNLPASAVCQPMIGQPLADTSLLLQPTIYQPTIITGLAGPQPVLLPVVNPTYCVSQPSTSVNIPQVAPIQSAPVLTPVVPYQPGNLQLQTTSLSLPTTAASVTVPRASQSSETLSGKHTRVKRKRNPTPPLDISHSPTPPKQTPPKQLLQTSVPAAGQSKSDDTAPRSGPQDSQFYKLPIPPMQLADFLAMQLRSQIEAANKVAESSSKSGLNLPFLKNSEEIMTALNAPILKAIDSPLLAALNGTVIKALEGTIGILKPEDQSVSTNILHTKPSTSAADTPFPSLQVKSQFPVTTCSVAQSSSVAAVTTASSITHSHSSSPIPVVTTSVDSVPLVPLAESDVALPKMSSVSQAEVLLTSGENVSQTMLPATYSSIKINTGSNLVKQKTECNAKTITITAFPDNTVEITDTLDRTIITGDIEVADHLERDKTLSDVNDQQDYEDGSVPLKSVEMTEKQIKEAPKNETDVLELKSDGASKGKDLPDQVSELDQVPPEVKLTTSATDSGSNDNLEPLGVCGPKIADNLFRDSDSSTVSVASEESERNTSKTDSGSEIPSSKGASSDMAGDIIIESLTTNLTESGRQTPEKALPVPVVVPVSDSQVPVSDSASSVCTIVSYGSLATKQTMTDRKIQPSHVSVPVPAAPSLRNLLAHTVNGVTTKGSSKASLITPLAGNVGSPLSVISTTASSSVNPALGTMISNTPPTSGPVSNGTQPINSKPGLNDLSVPSGFIAAPLDGAFRVTLPDETINKIIEDAIKSAGATLTPKAHEMVKSQLDRISVPREGSSVIKSEVMDEIISEVKNTSDAILSTCNITEESEDGNLTSSKTRRRNDPFFKLPSTGIRPIRNVQDDGTVTWTCTLCGKTFSRNYTYRRHAESHTKAKPWKCEICSKAFTDRRYLQKHMRWHTGKNLQYCCECGRAFSDELAVSKHMRVHNTIKSYACHRCPKVFADAQTLKRHNLHVHDQVKSHKCELCNLSFVFKSHLDDHMKRHTGEKPHRCSICGKGFIQVGTRNRHERQHKGGQGGNPYKCAICKNVFWFKEALRNHFYSMHPDIPVPETHKTMFEEVELAAQHSDVSEEETRIRVSHIPRERYPVEGEGEDVDSSEGDAATVSKAKSSKAKQTVFTSATLNGNEVEVKGPLKQLLVATGEAELINSANDSDSLVVENVTEVDSKEHLQKLVQEQEEKERQAANIRQKVHTRSHSDLQQHSESACCKASPDLSDVRGENAEGNAAVQLRIKTEAVDTESSVRSNDKDFSECSSNGQLGCLRSNPKDDLSSSQVGEEGKTPSEVGRTVNVKEEQCVMEPQRVSINAKEESVGRKTKGKLQEQTDKIASLMELFRETGVPGEITSSSEGDNNESTDEDNESTDDSD